ncbi:MAG TPA: tetratricopeptide repeat protein [Longimicrobiaceae bacterium]|nr:tetratricopeptide repeat protein [Longimicrobiaceae bacterium]
MKQPRRPDAPPRKPRRRWRWHVPPAIVHGPEALEGTEILSEYTGELGLVLWQSVRDISLWSSITPPEGRAGLFGPSAGKRRAAALLAADPDPGLTGPLSTIARILEDPAGTSAEQVMLACREISLWADTRGTLATALAFAQAAAFACPGNAASGLRVGQLARRRAEYARSETWFRRTIGLALQARDWNSYAEAFNALGNLYLQRGNLPVARQLQIRAYRAAKRHSLRSVLAASLHDMFVIAVKSGQAGDAEALARNAFEAYDPQNPRVVPFAHDVAYFWMSRGQFAPALSVFQALAPQIRTHADRHRMLGSIARAAGGAGDRGTFAEAQEGIWRTIQSSDARETAAEVLLDLARGAAALGAWADAEKAARSAEEIATERQEAQSVLTAQAVLEAVENEQAVEAGTRTPDAAWDADDLASGLVRSLEEHAAVG